MNSPKGISLSVKNNLSLNLLNVAFFLIVAATGYILQSAYHMHRAPEGYLIMGLGKSGWLLLHKASAVAFLAGIAVHCSVNWRFVSVSTRRVFGRNLAPFASPSYWLFIICIPACLTAVASWALFGPGDPARLLLEDPAALPLLIENHDNHGWILARFLLIESHDKLVWPLILLTIIHVVSRSGRMVRTYHGLNQGTER